MGWFDEQIRQRMQADQEVFEDSFVEVAGAVLGDRTATQMQDDRLVTKEALDEIMKYYHYKAVEVPEEITTAAEQLEYALRPLGLMTRNVELTEGWYKNAYGPMLGVLAESGAPVALLPKGLSGYYYRDPATGQRVNVNRRTAQALSRDAMCFYKPLPMKKLGIPDLMKYMKDCVSTSDILLIALATFLVTQVGMIEPRLYEAITGPVLNSKSPSLLVGTAIFLLCSAFAAELIGVVRSLLMERISTKTSTAVEASVMMRILSLPVSFFRRFSSGELSSRADSVGSLCDMLLDDITSVGMTSVMSLLYITQIFRFAPALVWPSIAIILATVVVSVGTSLLQINISRKRMQLGARESA